MNIKAPALKPRRLNGGDTIGIFSPSEPLVGSRLDRLDESRRILGNHGFQTKLAPNCLLHTAYTAGSIDQRVSDIHHLAQSPDIHALLTSWGGKSANQLLERINFALLLKANKPVLGFSDGCVLLNAITTSTGLITFYGPNVAGKLMETSHSDLSLIANDPQGSIGKNLLGATERVNARVLRNGRSQGYLFGGNLTTFVLGLLGSKYQPISRNGIFFWETSGHSAQQIHQYLTTLKNCGLFEGLSGMIVGEFISTESTEWKVRDPFEMLLDATSGQSFPILYCPTFGHALLENPIFPIGALCELDSAAMQLALLEPVVI